MSEPDTFQSLSLTTSYQRPPTSTETSHRFDITAISEAFDYLQRHAELPNSFIFQCPDDAVPDGNFFPSSHPTLSIQTNRFLELTSISPTLRRLIQRHVTPNVSQLLTTGVTQLEDNEDSLQQSASSFLREASTLRRITLSGSTVPVSTSLITALRSLCLSLRSLHLLECDVSPDALRLVGDVLRWFYPRWVTYRVTQLRALLSGPSSSSPTREAAGVAGPAAGAATATGAGASSSSSATPPTTTTVSSGPPRLRRLRVFISFTDRQVLLELARCVSDVLVEAELLPKNGMRMKGVADIAVRFVRTCARLRSVCLVTLDLSENQVEEILKHCGYGLRSFSFSPHAQADRTRDGAGTFVSRVLLAASMFTPNVESIEVVFVQDLCPLVESKEVKERLRMAVKVLDWACPKLDTASLCRLVDKMTADDADEDWDGLWY